MRPLFFGDEADASLIERSDAYYRGDAFLRAPITDPGQMSKTGGAALRAWFDFWSDAPRGRAGCKHCGVLGHHPGAGTPVPSFPWRRPRPHRASTTERLELHCYADASAKERQRPDVR